MNENVKRDLLTVVDDLEQESFYITGSVALELQGKLDRGITDIDIITDSENVLLKLKTFYLDVSDEVYGSGHKRYRSTRSSTPIDLFMKKEKLHYKTIMFEGRKIKVVSIKDIFIKKLEYINRTDFHKEAKNKCIQDLESYFNLTYNYEHD